MPKLQPSFVIVDDDEAARQTLVELCKNSFPGCSFFEHESLAEACENRPRIDVLLVDTSALSSGHWSFSASSLAKFATLFPHADVFVMSGMSRNAVRELIEDVQTDYGIVTRQYHACGFEWADIRTCIKSFAENLTPGQRSGMIS